jgi:hypothetical protein
MTMRLPSTEEAYQQAKPHLIGLLNEPRLKEWKYWAVIENAYPHDKIADIDHLLILTRESAVTEIGLPEFIELQSILVEVQNGYDCTTFNFPSMRSVFNVPHLHLYKLKKEYGG